MGQIQKSSANFPVQIKKAKQVRNMKKFIAVTTIALLPIAISAQEQTNGIQGIMSTNGQNISASQAPSATSLQKTYLSKAHNYTLQFAHGVTNTPLNKIVNWPVKIVSTSESFSLEGAALTVDGGMPHHGHGLPTAPTITASTNAGEYTIEGLKFSMPGYWEIEITITQNGISDKLIFGFTIN